MTAKSPARECPTISKKSEDNHSHVPTQVTTQCSPVTSQSSDHSRKLRGYLEVKHNPQNLRKTRNRLLRKCWRRQWVVLDFVDTLMSDSPALIARIYGSHLHEDRSLPITTVTLTDVHALHRSQSRSHSLAFSIDGSTQCLVVSGTSETETQQWMKHIRDLLWPRSSPSSLWTKPDSIFEVSLIDNVHSDIARLRGFYGQLVIEGREVLLVEARSGADQIRWPIKALKKWFLAKDTINKKEDKDKIVVLITHKNCSSGEGIFTFYSTRAKDIINSLHAVTKNQSVVQPSGFQSGTVPTTNGSLGRGRTVSSKKPSSQKMNPLLAFLRRTHSPGGGGGGAPNQQGSKARKSILAKSVSVMDHLSVSSGKREAQLAECVDLGGFEDPKRAESLERSGGHGGTISNSIHGDKKRSASESDLLNVNNKQGCVPDSGHPSGGNKCQKECEEGFYRSFDDIDDIDDLGVLAHSNPLEAAVVLRSQLEDFGLVEARCSFNSSDSGRMSDTYAETSNSSVTSSSNGSHSNRIYSNTSNCSADSGAQLSIHSDYSTSGGSTGHGNNNNNNYNNGGGGNGVKETTLGVLKEQASPNYPPFNDEVYGRSISIAMKEGSGTSSQHRHLNTSCSSHFAKKPGSIVGDDEDPTYSHIYEDHHPRSGTTSLLLDPPPLPPRFATVRKSFTLPHNMSGHASGNGVGEMRGNTLKSRELSTLFGLQHDQTAGSPAQVTPQMVAMQNLPHSLSSIDEQKQQNLEKLFGIRSTIQLVEQRQVLEQQGGRGSNNADTTTILSGPGVSGGGTKLGSFLTLPKTTSSSLNETADPHSQFSDTANSPLSAQRSRPNSLGFKTEARASPATLITPDNNQPQRLRVNNFRAFNKALSRLTALEPGENSRSLPTTPDYPPELESPRRKSLSKFLSGGGQFTPSSPYLPNGPSAVAGSLPHDCQVGLDSSCSLSIGLPPPGMGILKKSSLSNSTPMDLECGEEDLSCTNSSSGATRWQSNDGLATPGSLQGGCTPYLLTPVGSPKIGLPSMQNFTSGHPSICEVPSCGPKQSNSMFSIALATNGGASPFHTGSLQRGPLQYAPQGPPKSSRSCSLQRGSTLQATQPPQRIQRGQKSLTRSATLDDVEWQQQLRRQPPSAVGGGGGQRLLYPRGQDIQIRRHSFQQNPAPSIHNSSGPSTRRSQSTAPGDHRHQGVATPALNARADLSMLVQQPSSLENLTSSCDSSSAKAPKSILKKEPVYLTMGGSRLLQPRPSHCHKDSDYLDMGSAQSPNSVSFDQSLSYPKQHTTQAIVHTSGISHSDSQGQKLPFHSADQDIYDGITVVESQQISSGTHK